MTDSATEKTHREQINQVDASVCKAIAEREPKIMIIGIGQIGSDLVEALLEKHDGISAVKPENLILADYNIEGLKKRTLPHGVRIRQLDITDQSFTKTLIASEKPDIVINLAAVLSSEMKNNPLKGYAINTFGVMNTVAGLTGRSDEPILFVPSSIAATGCKPEDREKAAAQDGTFPDTGTEYGRTKQMVESVMDTLARAAGIRSVGTRWPVIASATKELTGTGTTEFSVAMFKAALRGEEYTCPIAQDRRLPMMTGEDAVRTMLYTIAVTMDVKLADMRSEMPHSHHYNMPAVTMTPRDLHTAIAACLPSGINAPELKFLVDGKDAIAAGWHAESEGSLFQQASGFNLSSDTPQRFAAQILHSFAISPDKLYDKDDSQAKKAEIDRNCADALKHLADNFGLAASRSKNG